ncbi:hypothetical protein PM8797T_21183 [Gimesia maris DSM 8797]|nr:hypothetical protein PM8797T_21183 [Gimesia maris DSM 8797]
MDVVPTNAKPANATQTINNFFISPFLKRNYSLV